MITLPEVRCGTFLYILYVCVDITHMPPKVNVCRLGQIKIMLSDVLSRMYLPIYNVVILLCRMNMDGICLGSTQCGISFSVRSFGNFVDMPSKFIPIQHPTKSISRVCTVGDSIHDLFADSGHL